MSDTESLDDFLRSLGWDVEPAREPAKPLRLWDLTGRPLRLTNDDGRPEADPLAPPVTGCHFGVE